MGRIRRYGLVGGSMSVEVDFESLKSYAILSPLSMPPTCSSRCESSVSCSAGMPSL